MKSPVAINESLCASTGKLLKKFRLRQDFYLRPFLTTKVPEEIRLRACFYSVAICHQTYNLNNKGLGLYGWDYLEYVFTRLMQDRDPFLLPGIAQREGPDKILNRLASLFSPDGVAEHTTLDRLKERTQFIIDLDVFVGDLFDSRLENLMSAANNHLLNNGKGFYEVLPLLNAFSDPMRKKITFLVKLLEEAGLVSIADKKNFIPIMDYHMQRVLLRTGCVEILDPRLHDDLVNKAKLDSDEAVRSACIDAFRVVADISGHPVTRLNDFFWSLGRSCCNTKPLCQYHHCEKDPCTFYQVVELKEHKECIFKDICKGFNDERFRKLWQPVVETHYY